MIAPRLIPREEWEIQLRQLNCQRVFGKHVGVLESAEVWENEHKRWFTVPVEENGSVDKWALDRLLQQIPHMKPLDLDT